jgi:large subunit ribosomal protein L7e
MSTKGFVPESYVKKQERTKKESEELVKKRGERKNLVKTRREEWRSRAQKYHENHRQAQSRQIAEGRAARNAGNFYVPAEAKVAFVVRLKGINRINPQVKKILQLFRLRQINNGVFIKINKATSNMLQRILPYVTYGYPTRKSISNLLYKRGFLRINRSRIPISDNFLIEQNLGKYGITSIEDLIEEIHSVGPHFKEANNFIWTFKLDNPKGGWRNKNHPFQKDGDWGNREEEINHLIAQML